MCISSQYPLLKCFSISLYLSEGHTNNFSRICLVIPSMTNVNQLNMHMGGSTMHLIVSWLFFSCIFFFFGFFYSIFSEDKSNSCLPVIVKTEHRQRDWSIISWQNYNSVIIAGRWLMTSLSYDYLSRVWIYLAERDSNWSAWPNPSLVREFAGTKQG